MKTSTLVAALFSAVVFAAPSPLVARSDEATLTTIQIDVEILKHLESLFAGQTSGIQARALTTLDSVNAGKCDDLIFIHARGTGEAGNAGNLGEPIVNAINAAYPSSTIGQGVLPYKADVLGYLAGGSSEGADSMVALTKKAISQCPNSRVILGGYSQGAQVAHLAAGRLPTNLYSKIAAIILVGDPKRNQAFPGTLNKNVLTLCNDKDLICKGIPLPLDDHGYESYLPRMGEVTAFIKSRVAV